MLDLRSIPAVVVNIPDDKVRRSHIKQHFGELGLNFQFSKGVTKYRKKRAVAKAHSTAFDTMETLPFWMAEDDVELKWGSCILPELPPDADIVYLATSHSGCCADPEPGDNLLGLTTAPYLALSEVHDENYARLSSMISAVAILVLTEKRTG